MATMTMTRTGTETQTLTEEDAAAYRGPQIRSLADQGGFGANTRVYGFSHCSDTVSPTTPTHTLSRNTRLGGASGAPAPDPYDPDGSRTMTVQEDDDKRKGKKSTNGKAEPKKTSKEKTAGRFLIRAYFRKLVKKLKSSGVKKRNDKAGKNS